MFLGKMVQSYIYDATDSGHLRHSLYGVYMVMVKSAVPVFLLHGDPVVAERPASRGGPQEGG